MPGKGIRYYVGHVYSKIASTIEGHVHDVAEDGTIDCAECAAQRDAPPVGTPAAEQAQATPELNPAAALEAAPEASPAAPTAP